MKEIKVEALDHELGRTPVTKAMHDAVKAAAAEDMVPVRVWQRQAYRAYLRQRAKAKASD